MLGIKPVMAGFAKHTLRACEIDKTWYSINPNGKVRCTINFFHKKGGVDYNTYFRPPKNPQNNNYTLHAKKLPFIEHREYKTASTYHAKYFQEETNTYGKLVIYTPIRNSIFVGWRTV